MVRDRGTTHIERTVASGGARNSNSLADFLSYPRCNHRFDAATNVEVANDLHRSWLGRGSQVVEYPIDRTLVEDAVVAVAPQVELEALELEAGLGRNVRDVDRSEVRRTPA